MVMIFSSQRARQYLLDNGYVYTFRCAKRANIGFDWLTDRRYGKKLSNIYISLVKEIYEFNELQQYVQGSGFETLDEWVKEICRLNKSVWGSESPLQKHSNGFRGILYNVKLSPTRPTPHYAL